MKVEGRGRGRDERRKGVVQGRVYCFAISLDCCVVCRAPTLQGGAR